MFTANLNGNVVKRACYDEFPTFLLIIYILGCVLGKMMIINPLAFSSPSGESRVLISSLSKRASFVCLESI